MTEAQVGAVYDQLADVYADRFPGTEPEQQIELAMVSHFVGLLTGRPDVLDAGCGAGRLLPVLAGLGCQVVGLDLSAGMIRRARRDHPEFATRIGSITDLPYPDGSFDGACYWYSTIHTPDERLPAVFAEARRVLRSPGHVLVAFQSGTDLRDVGPAYRVLGHDVELHRQERTSDQVADALRTAGLAEVARLVRGPAGTERSAQAVLIARTVD